MLEQATRTRTRVLFRKWADDGFLGGSVEAVFVDVRAGKSVQCYAQCCGHGPGLWEVMLSKTVPATPEEYADILQELREIGYDDLEIITEDDVS